MWKEAPPSVSSLSLSSETDLESSETHQIETCARGCVLSVTYTGTACSTKGKTLFLKTEEKLRSKKMPYTIWGHFLL
jgi:hypothetical protein